MIRVSKAAGKDCTAFGCSYTFDNYDGTPGGLHFFKIPTKNPEKRIRCKLIKRVDGMSGFCVTGATCLCQEHIRGEDVQ